MCVVDFDRPNTFVRISRDFGVIFLLKENIGPKDQPHISFIDIISMDYMYFFFMT